MSYIDQTIGNNSQPKRCLLNFICQSASVKLH